MMTHTTTRRGFLSSVSLATAAFTVGAGVAFGREARPAGAAQPKPAEPNAARAVGAPAALEVTKLADGLFLVAGAGGNIAVMYREGHILVVDAGLPDRAADVAAKVAELTGPCVVQMLVNTHYHFDHVGGNTALGEKSFAIVGTAKCLERLSNKATIEDLGMSFDPLPEAGRPVYTFEGSLSLVKPLGIKLESFAPAHTDTDLVVRFEKDGIVHTGDMFFNGMFPVIDRSAGGSLDNMIAATQKLIDTIDDAAQIIPGHGPMARKGDLKAQHQLLVLVRSRLAPFGEKKATMDEVLKAAPLADLDDKFGRGFLRSPVFTRMAYGQWLSPMPIKVRG